MHNLTDVSAFTTVQGTDDGDPGAAATFNPGYQALANRTRYLLNKIATDVVNFVSADLEIAIAPTGGNKTAITGTGNGTGFGVKGLAGATGGGVWGIGSATGAGVKAENTHGGSALTATATGGGYGIVASATGAGYAIGANGGIQTDLVEIDPLAGNTALTSTGNIDGAVAYLENQSTGTAANALFATATHGQTIYGTNTGVGTAGYFTNLSTGHALELYGNTTKAVLHIEPSSSNSNPTGANRIGDIFLGLDGKLRICTAAGVGVVATFVIVGAQS